MINKEQILENPELMAFIADNYRILQFISSDLYIYTVLVLAILNAISIMIFKYTFVDKYPDNRFISRLLMIAVTVDLLLAINTVINGASGNFINIVGYPIMSFLIITVLFSWNTLYHCYNLIFPSKQNAQGLKIILNRKKLKRDCCPFKNIL